MFKNVVNVVKNVAQNVVKGFLELSHSTRDGNTGQQWQETIVKCQQEFITKYDSNNLLQIARKSFRKHVRCFKAWQAFMTKCDGTKSHW